MPRKLYDNEKLRPKALAFRRKGLSYRAIAKKLGCSVYKVHELISEYESPESRLKHAAELAARLDELTSKVNALTTQIPKFDSVFSNLKPLEDLAKEVSKLKNEVKGVKKQTSTKFKGLTTDLRVATNTLNMIRRSVERRLRNDHYGCKWLDRNGYCTCWYWHSRVKGWNMRQDLVDGKTAYRVNVKKHPLICTACPDYKPRGYQL